MHHLITIACTLIATILWIAGINNGSVLLFVAAVLFELVCWARLWSRAA